MHILVLLFQNLLNIHLVALRGKYGPHLLQILDPLWHVLPVVRLGKQLRSPRPALVHALLSLVCDLCVEQVAPYDEGCSALTRMAVHEHLLFLGLDVVVHNLNYSQGSQEGGIREVWPRKVVVRYPIFHQGFGVVTHACEWVDSVTAVGVLAWLLQVEHSSHIVVLELLHDIELLNESVRQPLGAYDDSFHPLGVQTLDRRVLAELPVFMLTSLTSAKLAVQLSDLGKCIFLCSLIVTIYGIIILRQLYSFEIWRLDRSCCFSSLDVF